MLNISQSHALLPIDTKKFAAFQNVGNLRPYRIFAIWLLSIFAVFVLVMFLPWTQNITAKGKITTLLADQRPQSIHSVIGGRIEKWYVREGQMVKRGDTIAFISETKTDYFDPNLVQNTQQQLQAKEAAAASYQSKVGALDTQIGALTQLLTLKLQQTENKVQQSRLKVQSDSIDFAALKVAFTIAEQQYTRQQTLYDKGLKSLTDLEGRSQKYQEALAKKISQENKLLVSRNELLNAKIELTALRNEYAEKTGKAQSDKFSAVSSVFDANATVSKLKNQYTNYAMRAQLYYILAPQDCYISKLYKTGIGEIVKEGDELVIVSPTKIDLAVDMYIDPSDLPLIHLGNPVRFTFDGWPALVFSGLQQLSLGTFGGTVQAIDYLPNENNKYRVLVVPDSTEHNWPVLRVGTGAQGIALLQDVPIWYEIWRQLNAFPPDYYDEDIQKIKLKAPIKSIK
jgi:membrane fusion protein, adhesin transport system